MNTANPGSLKEQFKNLQRVYGKNGVYAIDKNKGKGAYVILSLAKSSELYNKGYRYQAYEYAEGEIGPVGFKGNFKTFKDAFNNCKSK